MSFVDFIRLLLIPLALDPAILRNPSNIQTRGRRKKFHGMIGFSAVERYSFFDGLYHADFYGPFAMRFMVKGPFPRPCGTTGETMGKNFIYALPLFVVR